MSWDHKLFNRHLTTRRFGRELFWFEVLDSTNRWLAENAEQFNMTGGVIVADHQTQGRGRYNRIWIDQPGDSLLFSVLLRHPTLPEATGLLSLIPAVALAEVLFSRWGDLHRVSLKWPNDVQVNGRKVAGILGQTSIQGSRAESIIGVGLNVTLDAAALPEELRVVATSLATETGDVVAREILLAELLARWELLFDLFLAGRYPELLEHWEKYGPARDAHLVRREGDQVLAGHYAGLGPNGQLLLRDESGTVHEIFTGDVEA